MILCASRASPIPRAEFYMQVQVDSEHTSYSEKIVIQVNDAAQKMLNTLVNNNVLKNIYSHHP